MFDDATKQEILFLMTLNNARQGMSEFEIVREIANNANDLGWHSYLDNHPLPVGELCGNAEQVGHTRLSGPSTWHITKDGTDYLKYLIGRYAPAYQRKNLTAHVAAAI